MAAKYKLRKASNGEFYFVLKASNGEVILNSERYASKASATNGIASVKTNAPSDVRYERKQSSNGQYMFNLKAANGERIGSSETYTTAAGRDNGIESVKTNAPTAATDDET